MAQNEDTELRDLVIESLEKNGSLAKVRALLRANIFLAFEDDCENMKHNASLDNILKAPEGILGLAVIHEFLEFCSLKNTLFVYKAESRQGKEYVYGGAKALAENLNLTPRDNEREPVLLTLIKTLNLQSKLKNRQESHNTASLEKSCNGNYKDDENCTYIVHEDSSSTNNSQTDSTNQSQSDNSSDEKNKLHLRLQLDNSDTDTSSDSARDKSSSEYIPSEHIIPQKDVSEKPNNSQISASAEGNIPNTKYFSNLQTINNSSDSTSYVELQPYSALEKQLINTTGVPDTYEQEKKTLESTKSPENNLVSDKQEDLNMDSVPSATLSVISSLSSKRIGIENKKSPGSGKSDVDAVDYSYDFTISATSKNSVPNDTTNIPASPRAAHDDIESANKSSSLESPHLDSQSSVSISDVADLIEYSDKLSLYDQHNARNQSDHESEKKTKSQSVNSKRVLSEDSGDFTDSPIPSLSNLSLEAHSD